MNSTATLLKTPLHDWHESHQGRMVDFAGWSMPVQYTSIIDEHHQTRKAIGLFDVSHMGRLYFSGNDVDQFLDRLTTRRIAGVDCGRIRYSLMTNEQGGILDDVLVYHLPDAAGNPFHMMVVNASNREKIVSWIQSHLDGTDVQMEDRTTTTAMIAVQGPKANHEVAKLADVDPATLAYYTGTTTNVAGVNAILSRTGYTGEDGCEIICEGHDAVKVWQAIIDAATPLNGGACGLASRDTLRLEAGMPLYGHELSEAINPAQADLKFAIQMKNREFVGKQAILDARKDESLRVRVGLELEGRRPAREECSVLHDEKPVGVVTSGTFAPTLQKSLSMAYVDRAVAEAGTPVTIDIRGKSHPAKVVALPFYQRPE
ncbi:MAG: glycine cleavage system aminomethyltransferase GcvT [Planctomycetota bacterium]